MSARIALKFIFVLNPDHVIYLGRNLQREFAHNAIRISFQVEH